ncbi:TadE/TadG family type IV pilus assembly protein [Streptomyces cyaneofuscatus]|uniref:Pilus assembly protein n=1 Tax=Streptomyces cyaneofuscatus TaxID=66883 RepID=A0ABZ1F1L3_9ACTN|nr:TadE/TadG family type IV pilus assembly protein [Streptomyces cyaneofuscatus]WSB10039.1 pilus assembly protein [Streptomyces cyaneofuscatus]WSD46428.1 pilus assembly protein [Streptomyces cyaneofuscatus]
MTTTMLYSGRIRAGGSGGAAGRSGGPGKGRDRGQVALEYLGFLPLLLLVAMGALQLGLAAYAANQAGTAARAGARTAASYDAHGDPETAARGAVSDWLSGDGFGYSQSGGRDITATVQVKVPSVVPGLDGWVAKRSATMPRE